MNIFSILPSLNKTSFQIKFVCVNTSKLSHFIVLVHRITTQPIFFYSLYKVNYKEY